MCIEASQRFHFHAFALTLFFLLSLVFLIADSPPPPNCSCITTICFAPTIGDNYWFCFRRPLIGDICFLCPHWSYYFHIWFSFRRPPLEIFALRFLCPLLELLLLLLASFAPVGATTITTSFFRPCWSY